MNAKSENGERNRRELYARARELDIPGRSGMSKRQLRNAVEKAESSGQRPDDPAQGSETASRVEEFRQLAQAASRGEFVMLPRALRGEDRRLHVRQTLREDHETRISDRAEDAEEKFDGLADSVFTFFRGTALLFYRDMAGEDWSMPTVLALGDVHPENFGVMPNVDNVPIFGVNDFDEAYYAPFTWDIKRGAVGFMLAAEEEGGLSRKRQLKIVRHFVMGYADGVGTFSDAGDETEREMRIDNAPKLIRKLFEDASSERAEWLADDYLDERGHGFRSNEELVPQTSRRDEFQALLEGLLERNGIDAPVRAGQMRLKDVALRKGQGTASLGLPRYYLLIEGPHADGTDDLIVEFKQARRSALAGLVPPTDHEFDVHGDRIAHAQGVQLARGDRFYGSIAFEGKSFMSRERAPFREDMDIDELSFGEWKEYARICGGSLAHAHALSDELGAITHDLEPELVSAIEPRDLFIDDVTRWAEEAAARVRRDHEAFKADHALGAFRHVDVIYR